MSPLSFVPPPHATFETLPGANGEPIDVTGFHTSRTTLPRQWYPVDVAMALTLSALLVLLVFLMLKWA